MHEQAHICLPGHAEKFTRTISKPNTYSKADIDDMVYGIYRAHEMSQDDSYKRLDDVYYPLNDNIERLNTHMDELKEEIDVIQRHSMIRSEALIDGYTRPSIDNSRTSLRGRLVIVKLLEDKLDEITFSHDLMREDFSQRLENVVETTHTILRIQQGCIGHLQKRMHVHEVDMEIMKKQWTRGDVAIRNFVGTWFQISKEDVDTCFSASSQSPPY
ncbi:hypothetical protein F2Q69_00013367 [Brassica cretica]|uniref:Uncharacterized protein n=1 Tax=Brassica cretica TaxID=69181 RepID=A0A8S9R822_BRACR|nr:hypothetical protein F2Q69_00013367 [Brassica cretica]